MVRTSKSPNAVAKVAYAIAQQSVPAYSNPKSPHKFTQPQLVTILVLKEFFKMDYRGIMELLIDTSDLRESFDLVTVPHYTTIQKAAHRLGRKDTLDRLTKRILATAQRARALKPHIALAAVDSTGFESHHTSAYFIRRRAKGGPRAVNGALCTIPEARYPRGLFLILRPRRYPLVRTESGRHPLEGCDHGGGETRCHQDARGGCGV